MTKWLPVLALAFSAAVLSAQDAGKKDECCGQDKKESCCDAKQDCCGDAHALFCGNEKCATDPKCKEVCEKAGATLKAVGVRFMELAKQHWGDKAGECCKNEKGEVTQPCGDCKEFCKTVIVPMIKERIQVRMKDPAREIKHVSSEVYGTVKETPCSFLKGETCATCVEEIAKTSFKQLKKQVEAKKAGCCEGAKPKQ